MVDNKLADEERNNDREFEFKNAYCFKISTPNIGSAVTIYYDEVALKYCCEYIEKKYDGVIMGMQKSIWFKREKRKFKTEYARKFFVTGNLNCTDSLREEREVSLWAA